MTSSAATRALKRKAWKKAGLCVQCGRPRAPGNKNFCEPHRISHNERAVRTSKARMVRLREAGLCVVCAAPAVNKTYCEKHRLLKMKRCNELHLERKTDEEVEALLRKEVEDLARMDGRILRLKRIKVKHAARVRRLKAEPSRRAA